MPLEQVYLFFVLAAALALFVLNRWRYDVVALLTLLALSLPGIVARDQVFAGFGHPAVVTVAAILVVSQGLANSGVVDAISRLLAGVGSNVSLQVSALCVVVAVCSAFMNNVGALALLMPVAVRMAATHGVPASRLLMPLAFGSLLGGMTTLIGTPPNIIIGAFRADTAQEPFGMFDFSAVGLGMAVLGITFISLVGWRLIPQRRSPAATSVFEIEDYTTELLVPEASPFDGKTLEEVAGRLEADFVVAVIVREGRRKVAPNRSAKIRAGDHLVVESDPGDLQKVLEETGFELAGQHVPGIDEMKSPDIGLFEAVVIPRSRIHGRTAAEVKLRAVHGLNLLGVARQGQRVHQPLRQIRFSGGDVLLVQGPRQEVGESLATLGLLPLAERQLDLRQQRRLALAVGIFGVALVALVTRVLPADQAFAAGAVAMVLARVVTLRQAYQAIDWPVVVLLGAMLPVGGALQSTGGAQLIANALGSVAQVVPLPVALAGVLILAMFLSDVMNNAATAVIMAPIALGVAVALGASPDPFLMAVAVGASCAFLTPIGHQSNTLVMGPGGYHFGDYWRMGLPLELLIVVAGVPLILWAWPP
ncbi:MAG: SLC13 family permease [Acidobacteriota bacterium]|nr:SLC13 family permease [Acidobacteriota bacterium]